MSTAIGPRSMRVTVTGVPPARSASTALWAIRSARSRVEDGSLTPALTTANVTGVVSFIVGSFRWCRGSSSLSRSRTWPRAGRC